jgi:MoxR-like ATPase
MAEKQVTIGDKTYKLDLPFMVLATQNPLEQEGTFSLPEAQLDRFLLKTIVDYPSFEEEVQIMKQSLIRDESTINSVMNISEIQEIQDVIKEIYVDDKIFDYITRIVFFTRESTNKNMNYLNYPVSPRASLALLKAAKAQAFLSNRDFVIPEDVKMMAYPVLRHRISLNYEAYADEVKTDDIIQTILENVEVL